MKLTDTNIKKFMALHQKYFAESISYEDAMAESIKLVRLFQIIQENIQSRERAGVKSKAPESIREPLSGNRG